ncbi:MAG: DUF2442 domain-containing protein, partial [Defluviitaleaceae bacterium]|nr:DUF2442 domain-containing protein [Defluviitaleaceae bacterium]
MEYYPEIYQVIPTKEHKIYLYFDDGTIRLFDASDLLANAKGRFAELLVGDVFMEACTVIGGTLAWTLDGS